MGMGFAPTWLRQVSPLLHKTTLTTGEQCPSAPQFWVSTYLCIHHLMQNYHRRGVTRGEGACLQEVSHAPPQGGMVPALPILGVPFYLRVHPLSL